MTFHVTCFLKMRIVKKLIVLRPPLVKCCSSSFSSAYFLTQLASLFSKSKLHGTVYVTMKQYHGQTKPKPRDVKRTDPNPHASGEPRCLFRATNGKKKYSTVVMHKDVNKFQLAYASLLKANIDNLKKRDKKTKKLKKAKATE